MGEAQRIGAALLVVGLRHAPADPLLRTGRDGAVTFRDLGRRIVPADLPTVKVDSARVQQALSNLVGNAITFTPKGGRIAITARRESASEVRISVRDTGPGMPPDQLPHIVGIFWQGRRSDRRGVGLGLAIVKSIIDAHDGRVWVESEVNVGREFIFTLPVAHD